MQSIPEQNPHQTASLLPLASGRNYALRTYLFSPANDLNLCKRSLVSQADATLIDLEDGVPTEGKKAARRTLERLLAESDHTVREIHVRVNQYSNGFDLDDLKAAVHPRVSAIRLPKVADAQSLAECCDVIDGLTSAAGMPRGSVRLYVTIESGAGMRAAVTGMFAEQHVSQFVFATGDLLSELGFFNVLTDGEPSLVARSQLVIAAAAMGIGPPVDGVYPNRDDPEGLRRATQWSAGLGFFGKSVVEESQVAIVNDVFTPSKATVERAHSIQSLGTAHVGELDWANRIVTLSALYAGWAQQIDLS